ncbi:hypothetical protein J3A83DRAFT_904354 [Scleroderma citrinum]
MVGFGDIDSRAPSTPCESMLPPLSMLSPSPPFYSPSPSSTTPPLVSLVWPLSVPSRMLSTRPKVSVWLMLPKSPTGAFYGMYTSASPMLTCLYSLSASGSLGLTGKFCSFTFSQCFLTFFGRFMGFSHYLQHLVCPCTCWTHSHGSRARSTQRHTLSPSIRSVVFVPSTVLGVSIHFLDLSVRSPALFGSSVHHLAPPALTTRLAAPAAPPAEGDC